LLGKEDQLIVDRLSDISGPLRPKETFDPYLSAYPLPSGNFYVVAKTWQDFSVPRAGCVRTKSILVDSRVWAESPPLGSILQLLNATEPPSEADVTRVKASEKQELNAASVSNFNATELLEALFLEEAKPLVVFDSNEAELIAVRLLAALWPEVRAQFAISTFALSPRKIGLRDFDLVFAPSSAKPKFADWLGRRLDGKSTNIDRHRWTSTILDRVLQSSSPKLLSTREVELLGVNASNGAAALRIVLLWDELMAKLQTTPTAALGLMDIANSGKVDRLVAIERLEPHLTNATVKAGSNLTAEDAWDFVGAIARKVQRNEMPLGVLAVERLAKHLAERAPEGAVPLLDQTDASGAIAELTASIASGLGSGPAQIVERILVDAPSEIFARLVSFDSVLASRVANDDALISRMGDILTSVEPILAAKAGDMLLPFLTLDKQLATAIPIVERLNSEETALELSRLGHVNDFSAQQLCSLLVNRARVLGFDATRNALVAAKISERRDNLLASTIEPVPEDVSWLLKSQGLSSSTRSALLVDVLRRANEQQFSGLIAHKSLSEPLLHCLPEDALDLLTRALFEDNLHIDIRVNFARSVIAKVGEAEQIKVVSHVLEWCLRSQFPGDEVATLTKFFGILGVRLSGPSVVNIGLGSQVAPAIASRNLVAFQLAPDTARQRFVGAVDEIASCLYARHHVDLSEAAFDACERLMIDASKLSASTLGRLAGKLMPKLLGALQAPVSPLISTLFPVVYTELARADDTPDFMKFFVFHDWDRCKTARHELVRAFMASTWRPGDLALTAFRCDDLSKILNRVAKSTGGASYLNSIEGDLSRLTEDCRRRCKQAIADARLLCYSR
jgi:GTPase-associated protein 1, N-terminal domain type 1